MKNRIPFLLIPMSVLDYLDEEDRKWKIPKLPKLKPETLKDYRREYADGGESSCSRIQ